jgi:hypothetical protein
MRKGRFSEDQMVRSCGRRIAIRWHRWPSGTDQRAGDLHVAKALRCFAVERCQAAAPGRTGPAAVRAPGGRRTGDLRARLPTRLPGHSLEAARVAVSVRTLARLAEGQEPDAAAGGASGGGGRVGLKESPAKLGVRGGLGGCPAWAKFNRSAELGHASHAVPFNVGRSGSVPMSRQPLVSLRSPLQYAASIREAAP